MRHSKRRRLRTVTGVALIAAPIVGLFGSSFIDPLDAQQDRDVAVHDHSDHDHGLAYTPMGLQFPPQPADLENVRWHGTGAIAGEGDRQAGNLRRIEQTTWLQRELGSRFERISTESTATKGEASNGHMVVTYMSHSRNRVVTALMHNGDLLSVESAAPKNYQPPLGPGEMADAIQLAREEFRTEGVERPLNLQGYAILALPTTDGVAFHNHRVAYVTFTRTPDVRPEFGAYVDLTDRTIWRKGAL